MVQLSNRSSKGLDERLDNFLLYDAGGIMIVDLEQVDFPVDIGDRFEEIINFGTVGSILYLFNNIRERKVQGTLSNNYYVGGS